MAYNTSDLDGTVIAPSVTYPNGTVKNAPSGTRVNFKMVNDMWQFFQKAMSEFGITPNNLPDNSDNGYQYFSGVQRIANAYAQVLSSVIYSNAFNSSQVYVILGCENRGDDGIVFYNREFYYVRGNSGPTCGGGLVDVLVISSPVYTVAGLPVIEVVCAASGSGISNFSNLLPFGKWVTPTGTTFTGVGGTVTVDPADIKYNAYSIVGRTVTYQIQVRNATFSGSCAAIQISLPFLDTDIVNIGGFQVGGFSQNDGVLIVVFGTNNLLLSTATGSNFANGTNNRSFDVSVTFEVE